MNSSAMMESYLQDVVNPRDTLRRDSQQQLLVNIDSSFSSHQPFQVIAMIKAKSIVCLCLLVYNLDKATNTMEDKLRVLMYAVCISCNDFPKVFIITQVTTSSASATSSSNTSV